jgi:hypothetical protein
VPPDLEAIVIVAPSAVSMGIMSEMGDAVAMLPPRQATLRIWVEANQRSMLAMARAASPPCPGRSVPTCVAKCSISDSGAHAPNSMASSPLAQPLSSGTAAAKRKVAWPRFLKRDSMPTSELPATSRACG